MRTLLRSLFVLSCLLFAAQGADAQVALPLGDTAETSVTLPDPLTPEAARGLVSTLSDQQVRGLLLEHLDAVALASEQADNSQSLLEFLSRSSDAFFNSVTVPLKVLPSLWSTQAQAFMNFYESLGWIGIFKLFGFLAIGLIAGGIAERITIRLTSPKLKRILEQEHTDSLKNTLAFLLIRLFQEVLALFVFFSVARAVGIYLMPASLEELTEVIVFYLIFLPRIAQAFLRFLLAPNKPEYRLMAVDDTAVKFLIRNNVGVILLMGFSSAILTFNVMNGVPMGTSRLGFWLNLIVMVYLIWIAWKMRGPLTDMMRGADANISPMEDRFARAYPYFFMALVAFTWVLVNIIAGFNRFDLLEGQPGSLMIIVLGFAPAMDTVVRGMVRHLVPPMVGDGAVALRAYLSTKRSYIRIGRLFVFTIVVFVVADIWGLSFESTGLGAKVAGQVIEFLVVAAFGYLVWELVSLWINRKLAAEQTALGIDPEDEEIGGGDGGGAGGSRLSTVLPLLLGISKGAIVAVFGLIALGSLGIDTTPLLAGAGILGLAIGFGAQRLVADIVSGIFFLIDDAFRTGEYLDIEGTLGTVEKISIRSMQLRHHKGAVHTIPYGEIPKITNYSRDWVIMKLRFTVPFDADPHKIKKMFKKIGADMLQEPLYMDDFLQPFKSQGVFDFDDVGMIIRGKFMTKPGKQFMIRKEIYNRVKAAFEEAGIEFARREVRVAIPGLDKSDELTDTDKAAIAAAASQAAQQQVEEETAPKDKPGA